MARAESATERSVLSPEAACELWAGGEVVPEHVEQRTPVLRVDVVGPGLDDARGGVDPLDVGLDDPEELAVRARGGLVDRCDLRLELQRALRDARWLDGLGIGGGQTGGLELVRLEAKRVGLVGRRRVATGERCQRLDLLDEVRPG